MSGRLFFTAVTGFMSGILCRSLYFVPWEGSALVGFLAVVFFCAYRVRGARTFLFLAISLAALSLGALRVALVPSSIPPAFASDLGSRVTLEGVIARDPDRRETSDRVTVEVAKDGVRTRILAVVSQYPRVTVGERVRVTGTLQKPAPFETDGGRTFRYDEFLRKDGIFAMMPHASILVLEEPSGFRYRTLALLAAIKDRFSDGIDAALPEPESALALGVLVGGKQGLGSVLLAAFTVAGLVQVVVLSGYNVMVVAEGTLATLRFLPRRTALLIAGLFITLFVVLAGAGTSAVRAGLMALLALTATAFDREYDALRALLVALVAMLLVNPLLLAFDPGLELSVCATLGLLLASPAIAVRLAWVRSAPLREAIATTLAAQLFVLPLLLYQSGLLSFVALPANLLVLPAVPIAMAASFLAGIVGMLAPGIAPVVGVPAYLALRYIIMVAEVSARIPYASVVLGAFPFALVLVAYAGIAFLIRKSGRTRGAPAFTLRTISR